MQLKRIKTLLPSLGGEAQIQAMAWSLNNQKFAVCSSDRVVHIFDEFGEKKDKFSTKPCDSKFGKTSYLVNALAFSPDASMLAVAQTDNIVFVYKIGFDWGDKKSIVAKLIQNSAITCMTWLPDNQIIFGLADGKIRSGNVKKNKSSNVYTAEHYTVALTTNSSGKAILSGHADGSIVRYVFSDDNTGESQGLVCKHTSPPYALAWTPFGILAGGCDKRIVVYTKDGRMLQQFDYSKEMTEKEFTCAAANPTGQMVVFGSYNRLRIFTWSARKGLFEEAEPKEFINYYSITSIAWKRDGSRLTIGNLTGCVDMFDSSLKKQLYKGKFEMTYVGVSQVIIRNITTNQKVDLKSHYGYEVFEVKVLGKDRYVVAHTTETLMIGDLNTGNLSEIPWRAQPGSDEKFYFDNENVCMIFSGGELTLVEYGANDVLCQARTEFMNPHLISVRLNERKQKDVRNNKKMAYLIDLKTISIMDLVPGISIAQIQHDLKIDWLELNETAKYLLFRDKKMKLHLYNVETRERNCILNFCTYVQWVPDSDVVVAQNRNNLCIWYNIEAYEKVTNAPIKGDIQEIKKENNKTNVVINEGVNIVNYELDSGLIEFGTAMEDGDLVRAVDYLETVVISDETETMWKTLARFSLESKQYFIAERCYAALGDVAKARYLRETNRIAAENEKAGDRNQYVVRARIAQLDKNFKAAESIYLENQGVDEAIKMYQNIYKWEEAIEIAEAKNHPNAEKLKKNYNQWLNDTEQFEVAALLKEKEHDLTGAINLYLRANIPIRASKILINNRELLHNQDLIEKIAKSLVKSDLYENAGELFEKIRDERKALECYKTGKIYRKAVDLARHCAPQEVVKLEGEWGDYLASQKLYEAAINHYIEAGESLKAIDASINSRQWKRALEILGTQETESVVIFYKKIADHFAGVQDFDIAEKLYIKANNPKECIEMFNRAGKWDRAFKIATAYLTKQEVTALYSEQAKILEQQGRYKEAEKLYTTINDPQQAIQMYKQLKNYDSMIRLIKEFYPDMVVDTYIHLAKELESSNNFKQAETYYIQGEDWKSAVNMYRRADNWEDAYKVAKNHGGPVASKQVAYLWAKTLGGDSAVKLLNKLGLLDQAIDFALENSAFDFAFDLAKTSSKEKLPEIHGRYAMYLEDEGRFAEAEQEFIQAKKPKEAVLMYVHNRDWDNAQRVAEQYDPSLTSDVLIGQAKLAFDEKNYQKAESFLLRAQRPEFAVKLYKDNGMWQDAFRVCKEYLPNRLDQLREEFEGSGSAQKQSMGIDGTGLLEQATRWESSGEYAKSVDAYLKIMPSNTIDKDTALKCWMKAFDISQKFLSEERTQYVAQTIGPRLVQQNRPNQAAELYLKADLIRECIDAFIAAEDWKKAKKVAEQLDPSLIPYVEENFIKSKKNQGDYSDLGVQALDLYANDGKWEECLKLAEKQSQDVLNKYVARYAATLIQKGRSDLALDVYTKYGAPAISQYFNNYQQIALDVFKLDSLNTKENYSEWSKLREILLTLNQNLSKSSEKDSTDHKYFQKMLLIAHYNTMRCSCIGNEQLDVIAAKLSISLLRHSDLIPADRAFYEAGVMCQKAKWDNMAFVFLNRYIDLADAIDDRNNEIMDNQYLAETDIPFEINLPESKYLSDDKHEEIKTWVIKVSMDRKIEPSLNKDERGFYEAALISPDSDKKYLPCVVTGYPVLDKKLEFKNNLATNVEDWNKYLMISRMGKTEETLDCVKFLGKWCDTNPNPSYNFNN